MKKHLTFFVFPTNTDTGLFRKYSIVYAAETEKLPESINNPCKILANTLSVENVYEICNTDENITRSNVFVTDNDFFEYVRYAIEHESIHSTLIVFRDNNVYVRDNVETTEKTNGIDSLIEHYKMPILSDYVMQKVTENAKGVCAICGK